MPKTTTEPQQRGGAAATSLEPALRGLRVLEWGDWRGEFCGRLLAGLGAEVLKLEPPGGHPSRGIGPFVNDAPAGENSLHWWSYNLGKRSLVLDPDSAEAQAELEQLIAATDVLIETHGPHGLDALGWPWERLQAHAPRLVVLSISDFGLTGPWASYAGGDLVSLALGGQMMVSGYAPDEHGRYDTPPMAPQMNQSAHMAGCIGAMDVLAALAWRDRSGQGQRIDLSLHAAANSCTENNLPWYLAAGEVRPRKPMIPAMRSRDGKYVQVLLGLFPGEWEKVVKLLDNAGMAGDLKDPRYADPASRALPQNKAYIDEAVSAFIASQDAEQLFHDAQREGVVWGPIREPHESLDDPHFAGRGNFAALWHAELGREVQYPGAPWVSEQVPWHTGPRAPRLGEGGAAQLAAWVAAAQAAR